MNQERPPMDIAESEMVFELYSAEAPLENGKAYMYNKFLAGFDFVRDEDHLQAFSSLSNVLQYTVYSPSPLQELLISLSYDYLKYSLGNAYKANLISNDDHSAGPFINEMLDIQNLLITRASIANDHAKEFSISMDRVQTFVLAGEKQTAIDELSGLFGIAGDEGIDYASNWYCTLSLEDDFLEGNISFEDYLENIATCAAGMSALASLLRSSEGAISSVEKIAKPFEINIFPNPTISGQFTVEAPSIEKVQVLNLLGKTVYEYNAQGETLIHEINLSEVGRGIYLVKVSDGTYTKIKRLAFQ